MVDKIRTESLKKWRKNKRKGFPCGKGSTVEITEPIRKFIEKSIVDYNIKSISDAACGDYSWMSLVNKHGSSYVGYDINDQMINELKYKDVSFKVFDITKTILPKTDLIICKDCLIHLTTEDGVKILRNFKKSGSKYLMTTTFDSIKKNSELDRMSYSKQYGFRRINVKIAPYNLGSRLGKVKDPVYDGKYFCMWEIN